MRSGFSLKAARSHAVVAAGVRGVARHGEFPEPCRRSVR